MRCKSCGKVNPSTSQFCRHCGAKLEPKSSTISPTVKIFGVLGLLIAILFGLGMAINLNSGKSGDKEEDLSAFLAADSVAVVEEAEEAIEEEEVVEDEAVVERTATYLRTSLTQLDFSADDGEYIDVIVDCDAEWNIGVGTASWVHHTRSGNTLTLHCDDNTSTSARTDWFTVTSGDHSQRINIRQSGKEVTTTTTTTTAEPKASITKVEVEHNVFNDANVKGMRIKVNFNVQNLRGEQGRCIAYFYNTNSGKALVDTNNDYNTTDGKVSASSYFTPRYDNTDFTAQQIFMPYKELHLSVETSCYFVVQLYAKGKFISSQSDKVYFKWTP